MRKLDIAMLVPGMPFQGDTLEKKSLGGSETAGLYMGRELARLGHHVTMFTNTEKPGEYDGVVYLNAGQWRQFSQFNPHDVTVIQRAPEAFQMPMNSKLNVLWCHDLALLRAAQTFKGTLWNVDKVMVVSRMMANQYKEVYGADDDLLWVTRNGIDLKAFEGMEGLPRDRKKLMYCARPERGLDVLLKGIFPKLLQHDPEFKLYLAAYDNTVAHMVDFYQEIARLIETFGDRVVFLGSLTKAELYRHYATAGAYVYPTPGAVMPNFEEVSCISAMEAMAAGLPMVTSERGALPETLGTSSGVLIPGNPLSEEYQQEFVNAVLDLARNDIFWRQKSQLGRDRAASLDWSQVAREWADGFEQEIYSRNNSPSRLASHFVKRSDIMAAKHLIEKEIGPDSVSTLPINEIENLQAVKARIDKDWYFIDDPATFRTHYEKIGVGHTDVFEIVPQEPRFQQLEGWLRQHPELGRILDYGCAHGGYAVNLCNRVGRKWVGVDVDQYSIDWCNKNRDTRGKNPQSMKFIQGDHTVDLSAEEPFDCVLAMEVLEHVPDPVAIIDSLERWVKPGGKMFITVPYGPWEYMSYDNYPHRCHIWEFDMHDLRDMLGEKKEVAIWTMPHSICPELNQPIGWYIIEYTASGAPTGKIDMERKLKLQRPRQTVSATIIAGPTADETLHWCLKTLRHVADEIIIGDTGMSDLGRAIAEGHGARIVPASNPLVEGFETPRNQALTHARMDWILWIDTDEKLIEPQNMLKYLRQNSFHGYSIRQHHFACDTTFKPDMPVRLFRNKPYQGKMMRFYGMIHEHPELALNEGPGPTIILSDVHIPHTGYLIESGRRLRFQRNYPLLQADIAKYPDRLLQKHFIMRDNMLICMYELQQNGGRITPDVVRRCEETIELWRKHFRGKAGYMNVDSIQYYSQAVKILGGGAEVAFQVTAGKDNVDPGQPMVVCFANAEDLQPEMEWRSKEAIAPFVSKWW